MSGHERITGTECSQPMVATSVDLAGDRSVIAPAEAVKAEVSAASNTIERERRLPPTLLDKLHEAQLFRLLLPRSSNGIETDPVTFFHVIETIAQADASTAWCLSQAGGCAMSAAYLDLPVARAIFGNDPRAVLAWGPGRRSRRSNARAATGSPASGRLPPAAATPPGSVRTARSSKPTARHASRTMASRQNAPCWYAAKTSNGPTSGTRSACAVRRAISSR